MCVNMARIHASGHEDPLSCVFSTAVQLVAAQIGYPACCVETDGFSTHNASFLLN